MGNLAKYKSSVLIVIGILVLASVSGQRYYTLDSAEYLNKVRAVWSAQMIAATMGFQFEHKVASVEWVDDFELKDNVIPVDDDWYYEMVALRAFEKYGINMSIDDLGQQWIENSAGTWGSSRETLRLLKSGIPASETGHPRYNKLWFTIGPQFSADIYGALCPGMPNLAARLANKFGSINGYAEAVDGAVFVAGMVSLGFVESNAETIVRKAAQLIDPISPYRKCIDLVIEMADMGASFRNVVNAVEDRWHIEYPATNNAVANGGIVAACVWYGKGDFLKTVNLAFSAADFTDADCNAANAASVTGAMKGLKGIPGKLLKKLGDTIKGNKMGPLTLTPPVDESLLVLSKRTVAIGQKLTVEHGAGLSKGTLNISVETPEKLHAETFTLADLTKYWNPAWKLERAGFGGANGGMGGIRGITYLEDSVLATYPRDEVRGVLLTGAIPANHEKSFLMEVAADSGRTWLLEVYCDNQRVLRKQIQGKTSGRSWYHIKVDVPGSDKDAVVFRLYQRVLLPGREAGNAYWKNLRFL